MAGRQWASALALWLGAVTALVAAEPRHVVLISIDGLRPEFYLPGERSVDCPTLLALRERGSYARAATAVYPSFTYPGHASIVTGVYPARHGVEANTMFATRTNAGRGYWYAGDLQARPLWDVVHHAGLTVGTVAWPSTAGAKTIDWNLPEFWTTRAGQASDLVRRFMTPGLVARVTTSPETAWDRLVADTAVAIFTNHQPQLLLVHLIEPDKVQHHHGRNAAGLPGAMRRADAHVARLMAAVKQAGRESQTTFIVLGDHGFSTIEYTVAPNVFLAAAGLITVENKIVTDWRAFVRTTGGSATVYLKDADDDEAARRAREVLLTSAKSPAGVELYRIVEKTELQRRGGPAGAVFGLEANAPYAFAGSVDRKTAIQRSSLKGTHGYLPDKPDMQTGLLLAGRGVKVGAVLETASLVDVAPTAAALLGLELAGSDGRVLGELLE